MVVLFYSLDADNDKNMSSTVLATDSVKAPDNIIVEMKKQPGEIQEKRSTAPVVNEKETSLEQLRMDIQKTILPKFNQTVGALPDSIMPGTVEWAEACRLFEPMITESLRDLIVIHQTIPMNTITKEFNDYVQSLLTVKMNKAIQSNN